MTTKTRLQKAEQAYKLRHGETIKVFIIFPDYVMHNGAKMTRAEYDALPKGDNDTVINVHYQEDGEKVTDFGAKRYIGVSPLDWDEE